jgi:hypothetical protein
MRTSTDDVRIFEGPEHLQMWFEITTPAVSRMVRVP